MFLFKSLITIPDVFSAISKVKTECNKVAVMSLFQVPITKSMRLEEFEQSQSQATSQVRLVVFESIILVLCIFFEKKFLILIEFKFLVL